MVSFELDSLLFLLLQILCGNGWDGYHFLHTLPVSILKSSQLHYFVSLLYLGEDILYVLVFWKSKILIGIFYCEWLIDRIVPLAMDRAIREIITPVVERSVTIACMTTRELVLKVCGVFSVLFTACPLRVIWKHNYFFSRNFLE